MPGKMARSDPRLSVRLPEVLVAVTPRVCLARGPGKMRTLMPVWDSSGESRLSGDGVFGIEKEDDHDPQAHYYRNCVFFNCFCCSPDSSSGRRRCLKDHL